MTTYAPGTVAVATVRGVEGVRVMVRPDDASDRTEGWLSADRIAGNVIHYGAQVTEVRPLVVLDLEGYSGERAVNYLRNLAQESRDVMGNVPSPRGKLALRIADQIEAQTKPPRIDEPGLWGVVEAVSPWDSETRCTYVRFDYTETDATWQDASGDCFGWDDLIDPSLVREGVESC